MFRTLPSPRFCALSNKLLVGPTEGKVRFVGEMWGRVLQLLPSLTVVYRPFCRDPSVFLSRSHSLNASVVSAWIEAEWSASLAQISCFLFDLRFAFIVRSVIRDSGRVESLVPLICLLCELLLKILFCSSKAVARVVFVISGIDSGKQ